jgi:hypothetical protein
MLIATELDWESSSSVRAFLQRAKDMGIYVVREAANLSDGGWERAFIEAMEGINI